MSTIDFGLSASPVSQELDLVNRDATRMIPMLANTIATTRLDYMNAMDISAATNKLPRSRKNDVAGLQSVLSVVQGRVLWSQSSAMSQIYQENL